MSKILVIDDENTILENLKFVLEIQDYTVITAYGSEAGINLFREKMHEIDVVVTDMKMPRLSGMDVLKEIKKLSPEMEVIVLTGHGEMENAILAMKEGAFEYLRKPVNADNLIITINNAIAKRNLTIENINMQHELLEYNTYFKSLLDSAQKILINIIPKRLPVIPGFEFAVKYKSSDAVGGDMYNVFDLDDKLFFYIFDVSSHGILASIITIILKSFIQNVIYNYRHGGTKQSLPEIISDLNIELNVNTAQSVFATLFMGYIEKNSKKFYYVSAGHITQYIFSDNLPVPLPSTGTVLGVFEDANFSCNEIQLNQGDKILLFTDGLTEATSKDEAVFDYSGVTSSVTGNKNASISDDILDIYNAVINFSCENLQDDLTILGIQVN
jgi:phosphoserine phosphatase RsbU/P